MSILMNIGYIEYTSALFTSHIEVIQELYSMIIPVDVSYDAPRDVYCVTALSSKFRCLEAGDNIPLYDVIITETPFGQSIKFNEKT